MMKSINNFITEKLRIGKSIQIKGVSLADLHADIQKISFKDFYTILDSSEYYQIHFYLAIDLNNVIDIEKVYMADPDDRETIKRNNTVAQYNVKDNDFLLYLTHNDNENIKYLSRKKICAGDVIKYVGENDYKNVKICYNMYQADGTISNWKTLYVIYNIDVDDTTKVITLYLCDERSLKSLLVKQNLQKDSSHIKAIPGLFDKHNEQTLDKELGPDNTKLIAQIPDKYKYRGKTGEATLFWKVYNTLLLYGPMPKVEVLETINKILGSDLQSTSYATIFAQWSKNNQIVSVKRKLTPQPYSNWTI